MKYQTKSGNHLRGAKKFIGKYAHSLISWLAFVIAFPGLISRVLAEGSIIQWKRADFTFLLWLQIFLWLMFMTRTGKMEKNIGDGARLSSCFNVIFGGLPISMASKDWILNNKKKKRNSASKIDYDCVEISPVQLTWGMCREHKVLARCL